jgi:hypothetical protein
MRFEERLRLVLASSLLVLFFVAASQYFAIGGSALTVPFALIRIEAFVLDGALRITQGSPLYLLTSEAPTTQHVYNYLTYFLPDWLSQAWNNEPSTLLFLGRLQSMLASTGISVLLGIWSYRTSSSVLFALIAALLPWYFWELALPLLFHYRPESLATMFSLAAIVLVHSTQSGGPPSHQRLVISALLCVIAFFFKQSFVAAPVAIAVHFLLSRRWNAFVKFCSVYWLALGISLGLMYLQHGKAYFDNTFFVLAEIDTKPVEHFLVYMPEFFSRHYSFFLVLPLALLLAIRNHRDQTLIITYFFVSAVWCFCSAGKIGAGPNSFPEFALASTMLIAIGISSKGYPAPWERHLRTLIILGLLIQASVASIATGSAPHEPLVSFDEPDVDLTPHLQRYSQTDSRLIFHEKIAIQLGNPIGFDWYLVEILAREEKYDPYELAEQIRSLEFDVIVFARRAYTTIEPWLMKVAVHAGYERVYEDKAVIEYRRAP